MKRVLLQPAYVLHRRAYRETSFLVDLFSLEHGRLTVVANGVRSARSTLPGLLQPFTPLLVSWSGKNDLMSLSHAESNGLVKPLQGNCLFAGFYLNELLMCLLQKWDAYPAIYKIYEQTILALQTNLLEQKILRLFEKKILTELGYGLLPCDEQILNNLFLAENDYQFTPEQGFVLMAPNHSSCSNQNTIFSGKSLLAIAKEDWQDEETIKDAKRLIRLVLAPLLGARPIYSRHLFLG